MSDLLNELLGLPIRVYISATGAGAGIQNYLWGIPGASKFLAGAAFPYAKEEMEHFIGFQPEKFVSRRTALNMAISAYLRANNGDPSVNPIGLGLTASVASTQEHRGSHRVCCAAVTRTGAFYAEAEVPKWVGRAARVGDGMFSDVLGLEVLLQAAGISLSSFKATPIKNVDQLAREAFFERSLFTRAGQRFPARLGAGHTIFPGAFNPPHEGHFFSGGPGAVFQITANPPKDIHTNVPHKPSLTLGEMLDRCYLLRGKRDVMFLEDGATYIEKARLFPSCSFVIGSDVVRRILDPRWGHEVQPLLEEFRSLGTSFQVGARGEDTFSQVLAFVPEAYRDLFSELPPSPYSDWSSSQIRAAKNPV